MATTTTVRVYQQPQAITLTITDEAYIQIQGSGRHYVAGKTKNGDMVAAVHSNTGNSTVFTGFVVDDKTYGQFKSAIEDADYHSLESIIQGIV